MTPSINPAFARFVVKIEESLPESLMHKHKLNHLAQGLTTHGTKRKVRTRRGGWIRKLSAKYE